MSSVGAREAFSKFTVSFIVYIRQSFSLFKFVFVPQILLKCFLCMRLEAMQERTQGERGPQGRGRCSGGQEMRGGGSI